MLYNVVLALGSLLLGPYFLLQAALTGRGRRGWRQRLGGLPSSPRGKPILWIHGVSVGEILAAEPLIEALERRTRTEGSAAYELVLSTVTETGQQIAHRRYGSRARIIYFPFDWPFSVARALERLRPSLVLLMETEIWPNFLRACARRHVPVLLVSGRLSERSFRRYRRIRGFMQRVLGNFRWLLMQSEEDAHRIRALGAPPERVRVVGNLKWDARPPADEDRKAEELACTLGLSQEDLLIVAGSTAPGEEALILRAFQLARASEARLRAARLLLAPRRPERFDEVEELLKASGVLFLRRTRAGDRGRTEPAEVILLDTLGELAALYRLARVAIIGGSFCASLAHNVIEPLVRGACVIVGPRYSDPNLPTYEACLWRVSAPPQELAHALARALSYLLLDESLRERLHRAAGAFLAHHRGATERILAYVEPLLAEAIREGGC